MKIENVHLVNLRNEEHYQFQTDFSGLVQKYTPDTLDITDQYAAYQLLYVNEGEALDVIRRSALTTDIADADTQRDNTFRGISDAVQAAAKHFKTEVIEAAARLQVVFDHYGNLTLKPYDEETAAITQLVDELQGTYATDVATVGITDWVSELKTNNEAFDTLKKERYTQDATQTQLKMKEVRMAVDDAYHTIVDRISALVIVNGQTTYNAFINELNARVEAYNNLLAQRKGRNSKTTTSEETK